MINLIKLLLVILVSIPNPWNLDYNEAKKQAKTEQKKILLNFCGSDWCGPCIKLKKDVFESVAFEEYATENLVLLKADFPRLKKNQLSKDQQIKNEILADKYNPKGKFPFTVLISDEGKILKEWEGYQDSIPNFLTEIKSVK